MKSVGDDCQLQIMSVAICLTIFGAHMDYLFIVKVKILGVIKSSYGSPLQKKIKNNVESSEHRMITMYEHIVQCVLSTFLFCVFTSTPNHKLLNIGKQS